MLRYVLTATAPETKDNDFTWKDFQARNNNELVAILGNFINRVTVLTHKYFAGKVPMCMEITPVDQAVMDELLLILLRSVHQLKIIDSERL
nr:class I tRNA ligase family protein [Pedobacter sp. PACM 27299]